MTNKQLISLMYRAELVEEITANCYSTNYQRLIVIKNGDRRVGAIFVYGKQETHWLILPRSRGRGYLSNALKTGIIRKYFKEAKYASCCNHNYHQFNYLIRLAGLKEIKP